MNKNPFVPQPSYTPQQPPLPPGPPPPQPAQPDYSAYWAAAAAAAHQPPHAQPPAVGQYNPQWSIPPVQPPRPPAEQSALYANYGYGSQNGHWQRQQQQQQQQQQLHQMQAQFHHPPPPPVVQPPPQPPVQPGYNPYQPTAGYPQQYVPQAIPAAPQAMSQNAYPHPQPQQQQQQHFFPQHMQQQQQQPQPQHQQQPQRHQIHHTPPQHLPPAKRQRFDGPNSNRHNQSQHHVAPSQPQFQALPPPVQNIGPYVGPGRGGPPGMNHISMGSNRGIPGGRGGPIGGQRGGRGVPMTGPRGGMAGGRGRGTGAGYIGGGNNNMGGGGRGGGGGGGSSGSLRGHGSRGNFGGNKDYQNRRGGGTGSGTYPHQGGSFRGRGGQGHPGSNRGGRHDGGGGGPAFSSRDGQASSSFGSVGKKDENRRTLTDFKIVGLEIHDLSWTWGILPSVDLVKTEVKHEEQVVDALEKSQTSPTAVKEEAMDEETPLKTDADEVSTQPDVPAEPEDTSVVADAVAPDTNVQDVIVTDETLESDNANSNSESTVVQEVPLSTLPGASSEANAHTPPPSRIRIYFHTPVTADDSRPIPHNSSPSFSSGATPSDSRKGKRKKLEDDDGDMEEERARPPPPQMRGTSDDRSSVSPSVAHSAAETVSEADWLMAAIVEGEEDAEAEAELDPAREGENENNDPEEDEDQLHVSQLMEADDNDDSAEGGVESPAPVTEGIHVDVDMVTADGGAPAPTSAEAGGAKRDGDRPAENGANVLPNDSDVSLPAVAASFPAVPETNVAGTNGVVGAVVDAESASATSTSLDATAHASDHNSLAPVSFHASSVSAPSEPCVSDSAASSQNDSSVSSVEEQSADHVGLPDTQVSLSPSRVMGVIKSLLAVSTEPTLLNIDSIEPALPSEEGATTINGHGSEHSGDHEEEIRTQMGDFDIATQEVDHLPEPPASPPLSNAFLSTPSTSTFGDSPTLPLTKPEVKPGRTPSANRLSISYAGGNRRLVIDAEVVDSLKVFRQDGRIEVAIHINKEGEDGLKGILVEGLSEITKSYLPLQTIRGSAEADPTLPPFSKVSIPSSLTLRVYLDTARPLSEPKWAKSGDIQEWLKSMFGRMFWVAGDAAEGWEKKIQVVDPDPPPTIWTVLDGWAVNSPAGVLNERQRFLKTHMTETDNILEILLRLVRGERATASYQSTPAISAPSLSGPLLSALSPGSAHSSQQTHVSLAVLAMFRMSEEYAKKALGDKGKGEVEERVGEIIRCLPSHLVYKSLDGIFKEWRVEKKGR